jgi:pyruvate/2-oxoglutarate dehydrogenase complex dihydrolipoamide dehydrogenase (E3) component
VAEREFDAVVVGAGPAGEVAAGRLADAGLDVAIVEQELVGGECSFYACMPSKGLLRPGELLAEVRRIPGAREAVTGRLDVEAVFRRRDEIVHGGDDSSQEPWLRDRGIELVRERGRLDGERRVRVGDDVLVARRGVIVAAGSDALVPPIDGLREAPYWTNRDVTRVSEVPERLTVLGGGVVGAEMGNAFATFGSKVTVIEGGPRLIAREEEFAAEHVAAALRELGADLRFGAKASAVRANGGEVTVELEDGSAVNGDRLLVAIGRRQRTDDLGLETVGLEPGRPIEVDDRLRANDWLYAIGDVNGRVLLTHMGKYQARVAADAMLGRDTPLLLDGVRSPRVIFTDPQVAAVGHTEASAKDAGLNVRVVEAPTQGNAGASFYGRDTPGTTRLVIDHDRGTIAGATFTGFEVAEMVHAATVAIVGEVPLERLAHAVPSFPTRSEVWLGLLEEAGL